MVIEKYRLNKDKALLVVVDLQEKLMVAMKHKKKTVGNCITMIEGAKVLGMPVIVTEQYPKGLGQTIKEIRDVVPEYKPVEKITFGCCGEPSFVSAVKDTGKTDVVLIGAETHVCVLQTCLGLLEAGYKVHLVRDAVCSRSKDNFLVAVQMMQEAGAVITSTETALFELLYQAGSAEFKAISKLVK